MDRIVSDILNPEWIFSVIFIAFLINLAASYAKPVTDRILSGISSRFKVILEKSKQDYQKDLSELTQDASGDLHIRLDVIYYNVRCVLYLLMFTSLALISVLMSEQIGQFGLARILALIVILVSLYPAIRAMRYLNKSKQALRLLQDFPKMQS